MISIPLPLNTAHTDLLHCLQSADCLRPECERLVFLLPEDKTFLDSAAIALLCSWGMQQVRQGRRIEFFGRPDPLHYLSRIDLFRQLRFEYPERFTRRNPAGRFIPLHLVEDSSSTHRATHAICDLVLHTIPAARLFLPAMEWAVCEVIDNIQLHAQSPVPGVVCAQFFPRQNRLDIAICDAGRGIKASLSEAHNLPTHAEAIRLAIQRGVTRSQAVGQGNGLAGSVEIARLNQGEFHLWTGDVDYHTKNGRSGIYAQIPTIPGTGVFFRLDTRHPVDLSHTFIGRSDWTYLDYAAGHISDAGGLRVLDECPHASGRTAGRAVRLKVLALLPTLEEPLVLDFSGVESATSSFLDELLGRLADELGPEAFRRRIQVANLAPALSDMANVVIHQRVVG